jgi:hypothetical protein
MCGSRLKLTKSSLLYEYFLNELSGSGLKYGLILLPVENIGETGRKVPAVLLRFICIKITKSKKSCNYNPLDIIAYKNLLLGCQYKKTANTESIFRFL